ncbi:outer membrane protein assembly factor BamE [Tsuneonella amylolytica]|uniref:outer membrane protein assembly factor BamE n=1 Tax=Tsuneonella amylolytica TaxID=2338327 RepID=UPI000EA97CE4|nr:outer membrane protein assembly factor BamE [Tsuneonella amylolytica]
MTVLRPQILATGAILAAALAMGGCASIRENRGFIADPTLVASVQPGIDNRQSVEATLGHPSFESQFGTPTWYYVSSTTGRRPFVRPEIDTHQVLAVQFDAAGNVASVEKSGLDKVVYLSPDGDSTPTVGRERGFFEDLFGNIGTVGAPTQQGTGPNGS